MDLSARNNFSRFSGLVLLASNKAIAFLIIWDDAASIEFREAFQNCSSKLIFLLFRA
jgi:hypothetical protein